MIEPDLSYTRGAPTRQNFVEPAPIVVRPWRSEPAAPQEVILRAPVEPEAVAVSETDRAVAFNISTAGLALIVGLGGLLLAVVGWKVPLLSVTALAVFFGFAALIWAGAWLFHAGVARRHRADWRVVAVPPAAPRAASATRTD